MRYYYNIYEDIVNGFIRLFGYKLDGVMLFCSINIVDICF